MIHRMRPADSSDFDRLLALHREGRGADEPARVRAEFTQAFATQDLLVVEIDGEPAGMLAVDEDEDPLVLQTVEVAPAWQGRGLGTRLIHDVLLRARELGRGVVVDLPAGSPAVPMLRRLGSWPVEDAPGPGLRLRWDAGPRTDVTLRAAMSPWADTKRRRTWARRLFEADPTDQIDFARFVAGRYGVPEDAVVLDLHTGTGRRLRALAAAGWRVTGREPDAELRTAAEHVAAVARRGIEVVAGDLHDLEDQAAFDLVLAFDGALWTRLEHDERVEAARRLRRALRPGGVLVIEGPNAFTLLPAGLHRDARTELYHRARVSRLPQWSVDAHRGALEQAETLVVEVDDEEVAEWTERRQLALLGRPQVLQALEQAGFSSVETFRDLAATAIGRAIGPRVVLTAMA